MESRRSFIRKSILAGTFVPFLGGQVNARVPASATQPLKVHVFSKHLQFLDYQDMAAVARDIGFDGVDLTVRPKGHVLPERVETDLPKAIAAIRKAGLAHTMMTTAVGNASNASDRKVLETAAANGVRFYRMTWLAYPKDKNIPDAVAEFQQIIRDLSLLNKQIGIVGAYQNHAGLRAGASIWELYDMVQKADKTSMGVQYDIRHAMVEGGLSWQNGLRLIRPEIKTIAIKDFVWAKKDGVYVVQNVPLGEGMVDFKKYFTQLKEYGINVPVSMHFEYPLGGAERGETSINVDKQVVYAAMRRDLQWLRDTWKAA